MLIANFKFYLLLLSLLTTTHCKMFLLIHFDDFEDIREVIDYSTLPSQTSVEDDEQRYIAIKQPENLLHNVPNGIITTKSWDALTFYIWIEHRWRPLDVSAITDDLSQDSIIEVIELTDPTNLRVDYDTHRDCYCKTEDVCGCGCDPLHDGW